MGQNCSIIGGTVVTSKNSLLLPLYKISFKQWQDAAEGFYKNYANVVRLNSQHVAEILEDLSFKRRLIQDVLLLLGLPDWQEEDIHDNEERPSGRLSLHETATPKSSGADCDAQEFFFSMMMLSTGTMLEKVTFFLKRYDPTNAGYVESVAFLMIMLATAKGLHSITQLTPPSFAQLRELSSNQTTWTVSDVLRVLDENETAKLYLEAISDVHSIEDALVVVRKLKADMDRSLEQHKRRATSDAQKSKVPHSLDKMEKNSAEDADDLHMTESETNLLSVVTVEKVLCEVLPNCSVDYDIFIDALREAEFECDEAGVEFNIRNGASKDDDADVTKKGHEGIYAP
eukprot:GEMP01060387.1.p1 GENE.GEMP01060387.1~~GEMP01060387.1.p1  ORF type:complete len:343 (+),score=58.91 GEMP01060387.1:25-1053(+)